MYADTDFRSFPTVAFKIRNLRIFCVCKNVYNFRTAYSSSVQLLPVNIPNNYE